MTWTIMTFRNCFLFASFILAGPFEVFAAPPVVSKAPKPDFRQDMIERHKRMAKLHDEMSKCLDSGGDFEVCQQQMLQNCKNDFGADCPKGGKHHMMGWWWDGCWPGRSADGASGSVKEKQTGSK